MSPIEIAAFTLLAGVIGPAPLLIGPWWVICSLACLLVQRVCWVFDWRR